MLDTHSDSNHIFLTYASTCTATSATSLGMTLSTLQFSRDICHTTTNINITVATIIPISSTMSSRTAPNQDEPTPAALSRTGIMDLPKELLLQITSEVLTRSKPITLRQPQERRWTNEIANLRDIPQWSKDAWLDRHQGLPSRKRQRKSPLLKLILVCKEFYFAGIEAYYSKNTFQFDSLHHFRTFSEKLETRQRMLIERVNIEVMYFKKTKHEDPPVYVPMEAGNFATHGDLLEGFVKLKHAGIMCKVEKTSVYMAAASRARPVKQAIKRDVIENWRSRRDVILFKFPREWGLVEDK